jgi:hypothetical protein
MGIFDFLKPNRMVVVPIDILWEPKKVVANEGTESPYKGHVEGTLSLLLEGVRIKALLTIVLGDARHGHKVVAQDDKGHPLCVFSEETSVEEIRSVGEYIRQGRPAKDEELSSLVSSIMEDENPISPFKRKIKAEARVLTLRPTTTRCMVQIYDSVWVVEVIKSDIWGIYDIDIGNLKVLPESIPIAKDLLVNILYQLIPPQGER